jgi:hypothetical protein
MRGLGTDVRHVGLGFCVAEGFAKDGLPLLLEGVYEVRFPLALVRVYKGLNVLKRTAQLGNCHNM